MDKIVLDCQKCGGALEITGDVELFKCQYCGTPYLVKRSDGSVRVSRLEERVSQVEEDQAALRVSMLESRILQARANIAEVFRELDSLDDDKKDKFSGQSDIEGLYQDERKLREQYASAGGTDPAILNYVNPLEVLEMCHKLNPKTDWKLGYAKRLSRTPLETYMCPCLFRWGFFANQSIWFLRDGIQLHVSNPDKDGLVRMLQKRYPKVPVK